MSAIEKHANKTDFIASQLEKTHNWEYAFGRDLFKMGSHEISVNNMLNHANVTHFCPYHTEIGNSFFSLHYP